MSRFLSIRFDGISAIKQSLDALPEELQKRVIRSSIRKAAKIIEDKAKSNAPVDSVQLRDSIRITSLRRKNRRGVVGVSVTPGAKFYTGDQYYAAFIEFGYTRTKRFLTEQGWRSMRRGRVAGPVEPRPFLRPALDQSKGEFEATFRKDVKRRVALTVAKLARKSLRESGVQVERLNTRRIRTIARRAARGRRA